MRFKCDYSDSIDETFKMIMPIANKKDELIHHVYIGLNKSKNFTKNIDTPVSVYYNLFCLLE